MTARIKCKRGVRPKAITPQYVNRGLPCAPTEREAAQRAEFVQEPPLAVLDIDDRSIIGGQAHPHPLAQINGDPPPG